MRRILFTLYTLLFTTLACSEAEKVGGLAPSKGVVIVGADYASGSGAVQVLSLAATVEGMSLSDSLVVTSSDPVARVFGQRAFVLNRFLADNVQVLDPTRNFAATAEYSLGNGSNPHDVLQLSETKAYVTRYDHKFNDILVMNPATGQELGTITLGDIAGLNPDHAARPHLMALHDDLVYVTLQNLSADFMSFAGTGLAAIVDPKTDRLVDANPATPEVDAIDLGVKNPGEVVGFEDALYVIASGSFSAADPASEAGLVRIDPKTRQARLLVSGQDLGGWTDSALVLASETKGYLGANSRDFVNPAPPVVRAFNPVTGAIGNPVYTGSSAFSNIGDLALDSFGFLHILDSDPSKPGVVVLDTKTDTVAKDRFQTVLPPVGLAVLSE